MKRNMVLGIVFFLFANVGAQKHWTDSIHKETIKTVQIYKDGWDLSYPVIELDSYEKIKLSFDDLQFEEEDYSFEVIHCDDNWNTSDLQKEQYLEGYFEDMITEIKSSMNTTVRFYHYNVIFPNEYVKPLLSGNYIIRVFYTDEPDETVLTRRFYIVESKIEIEARVKQPSAPMFKNKGHEIDFTIYYGNYDIVNPEEDIIVKVSQNFRWDNAIVDLKPSFINNSELIFDHQQGNIFWGGNEYRNMDLKNIKYLSPEVKNIEYRPPRYHVILNDDEERAFEPYFFEEDLNGKFAIAKEREIDNETDADYLNVHFKLPYFPPMIDGNLYVFGALTNWQCKKGNELIYDYDEKSYHLTMNLKQGYYNYEYAFVPHNDSIADVTIIEGSFFDTENDYMLMVYHMDFSSDYVKLIGFDVINSLKDR